ncbi:hypothetical protein D3C80_991580 [compost metagenome]
MTTISSVSNTRSTMTPKVKAPTRATTMQASPRGPSGGSSPSKACRETSGNSRSRRRSTSAPLICSMRRPAVPLALTSSMMLAWGMAKRSPQHSTTRPAMMLSVRGMRMVKRVPCPSTEVSSTAPPMASILVRTTSMPTPRPDTAVTEAAVEKPGRKISWRASASLMVAAWAGVISPASTALSRRRAAGRPRPSSAISIRMAPPSCRADRAMRPVSGLPAARRCSGVSSP